MGEPPEVSRRSLGWLQLSDESGVVALLKLDGRYVTQGRVKPFIVVPLDPRGSGVLHVGNRLLRTVVEDRRANAPGFMQAVDRLQESVDAPIVVNSAFRWLRGRF